MASPSGFELIQALVNIFAVGYGEDVNYKVVFYSIHYAVIAHPESPQSFGAIAKRFSQAYRVGC